MPAFKFEPLKRGYKVKLRGKHLGDIIPSREPTGRHCFFLAFDKRRKPRTYRGKIKAAEALLAMENLKSTTKKKKWNVETLIINAWDDRPRSSDQW